MYRNHTVGVVIPAYNEAAFVGDVVETVPDYVDRVYVVDDGSTDDTWAEITAAAERMNDGHAAPTANASCEFDERVRPIQHDENRGVGGAIKTGYRQAREDRIDVTAVMGGDGQMQPKHLQCLLDPIVEGDAEYAKGNRLIDAETAAEMPRVRQLGNRLLSGLTKIASGYWGIEDPQNGYTAISLSALDAIDLDEMYEFYGYCNDLLVTLSVRGVRVADVPQASTYADEESHISYTTYVPRVSAMLLRNFLWRLREQYVRGTYHPTATCYVAGILTGLFGAVLATVEAASPNGRPHSVRNALRTGIGGVVLFGLATVLERLRHADLNYTTDAVARDNDDDADHEAATADDRRSGPREPEVEADWQG